MDAWEMELGAENRWRVFDTSPTGTTSSHTTRALRQTDRRVVWQVSRGFWN